MEAPSQYTAEHALREVALECESLRMDKINLLQTLRRIKTSRWYRLGKFLRLCP